MTIIRGAISVDVNTKECIAKKSIELFTKITDTNEKANISALFVSVTKDINSYNPCTALRNNGLCQTIPLECFQEADIVGQMNKIIRMTVLCSNDFSPINVYLGEASQLRPEFAIKSSTTN